MKILLILSDGSRKGPLEDLDVLSAFVRGKLPRDTLVKPVTSDAGWTEIGTYFSSRHPADAKRKASKSHGRRFGMALIAPAIALALCFAVTSLDADRREGLAQLPHGESKEQVVIGRNDEALCRKPLVGPSLGEMLVELCEVSENIEFAQEAHSLLAESSKALKADKEALEEFKEFGKTIVAAHGAAEMLATTEERACLLECVSGCVGAGRTGYFDINYGLEIYQRRVEELQSAFVKNSAIHHQFASEVENRWPIQAWKEKQNLLKKSIGDFCEKLFN